MIVTVSMSATAVTAAGRWTALLAGGAGGAIAASQGCHIREVSRVLAGPARRAKKIGLSNALPMVPYFSPGDEAFLSIGGICACRDMANR
jgi:hypothetical protein